MNDKKLIEPQIGTKMLEEYIDIYVLVNGCSEGETWRQALEHHSKNPKIKKNTP